MVQKKQEITYRELRKEDYPRIENILGETWALPEGAGIRKLRNYWKNIIGPVCWLRKTLPGRP